MEMQSCLLSMNEYLINRRGWFENVGVVWVDLASVSLRFSDMEV